ncbi:Transformer-2 protein-like protein [Smittium culicis]|uniref:Transformer-2 protein-like protein n=1 Tax=Smittium culicis TaxID=133412 RepID=A0A1R1YJB6_9FUNG|nr:Transformer-2 protein-like protein [Smittium culicis]
MTSPIITSEPLSLEPEIIMSTENESENFNDNPDEGIKIKNTSESQEITPEANESGWGTAQAENTSEWNASTEGKDNPEGQWNSGAQKSEEAWQKDPEQGDDSKPNAENSWDRNPSRSASRERSFRPRRSRSPRFRKNFNKTRSRGYGFVTMASLEAATEARNQTNGMSLDGRKIRVDYSLTQKPHSSNVNRDDRGGSFDRDRGDRFDRNRRPSRDRFNGPDRNRSDNFNRGYRGSRERGGYPEPRRDRSPIMDQRRRNERSRSFGRGGSSRRPPQDLSPRRRRDDSPHRFSGERRQDLYRMDREPERNFNRGPDRGQDRGMDRGMHGGFGNRRGDRNPHFENRNSPFEGRERRDRDRSRGRGPPHPSPPPPVRGRPVGYNRSPPYNNERGNPPRGGSPPRRPYGQNY